MRPSNFLSRAGLIDLLQLISAEVIVPESVAKELKFEVRAIILHRPWPYFLACGYSVPAQIQAWD